VVLIDTSVWIAYFRDGSSAAAAELDLLLDEGHAVTCGLVEAELLPGLKSRDRERIRAWMSALPRLAIPNEVWPEVGAIQEKALAHGVGPFSVPDLVIAATSLLHDASVFTLDRHFKQIASLTGLRLHIARD
jgi:predicted nucleic acid-binding protein